MALLAQLVGSCSSTVTASNLTPDVAPSRVSISERTRTLLNESLDPHRMSFLDLVPQPPASAVVEATKSMFEPLLCAGTPILLMS